MIRIPSSLLDAGASFLATAFCISFIAAASTALTVALGLPPWMMFIGWITWATAGNAPLIRAAGVGCMLVGLILGNLASVALATLQPQLGSLALPIVVFAVTIIVIGSRFARPFDSGTSYYLGLVGFFAAGAPPGVSTFAGLAIGGVLGAVSCAAALTLAALAEKFVLGRRINRVVENPPTGRSEGLDQLPADYSKQPPKS